MNSPLGSPHDRWHPIRTPLGELQGRDCLYLDGARFEDGVGTFVLEGEANGNLCTPPRPDTWVPYVLRFTGVSSVELVATESRRRDAASCLDEMELDLLPFPGHVERRFAVDTYGHTVLVTCREVSFEVDDIAPP